ncbi:putative N-acetyltransferase YjaB [Botrimarina colliarenosi]|uniref:Putative N-acetyltransferase YjaB n=1 Tax=Botrimarina colliarenosi TaxID=2528001 RepID=A0A5C6A5G2_9BACT|nr:GNAT family N-acetyltransferase [Botrimarina colliarenosi]TWT95184.1 putative N-acetyltransferase YjaB [Botrimarina colliarenosi]
MLRKYQEDDVADVVAVWEAATRLAHPFLSEAFLTQERHNLPNLYLPNAETWVWVAEGQGGVAEGRVVGFVALLGAEIGGLFVDPPYSRQGIGGALLQRAREEKGTLEVEVFEANPIGRAFYARHGFIPLGQSTHEPTGQTLLRLRLPAEQPKPE